MKDGRKYVGKILANVTLSLSKGLFSKFSKKIERF